MKSIYLPHYDPNKIARGPILKDNGRYYVNIRHPDENKKYDITYAKYILEQYLERTLSKEETVDHLDRDCANDKLANLRVVDFKTHLDEDVKRVAQVNVSCIWCHKNLTRTSDYIRKAVKKNRPGPFCAVCKSKYIIALQKKQIEKLPSQKLPEITYYYKEKSSGNLITDFEKAKKLDQILIDALLKCSEQVEEDKIKNFRKVSWIQINKTNPRSKKEGKLSKVKRKPFVSLPHFDTTVEVGNPHYDNNRRFVYVKNIETGIRKHTTYARYVLEQKLGRYLTADEDADHIDRDRTNDHPDNLQIIAGNEHAKYDARYVKPVELSCNCCGKILIRLPGEINDMIRKNQSGPFCNQSCFHQYKREVKQGLREAAPKLQPVIPEYYYGDKPNNKQSND